MDDGEGNHVEPAITLLATNHRDDGDGDGGDDGDGVISLLSPPMMMTMEMMMDTWPNLCSVQNSVVCTIECFVHSSKCGGRLTKKRLVLAQLNDSNIQHCANTVYLFEILHIADWVINRKITQFFILASAF